MGREIRRVPKGWVHPRNAAGHIQPMRDEDYATALAKWRHERAAWKGEKVEHASYTFEQWHGEAPNKAYYRPKWTDKERTCFQVYETVSEGTPVSPVFETEDELRRWLVGQGHSEAAAQAFIREKWAPSMVTRPKPGGGYDVIMGIDALEALEPKP